MKHLIILATVCIIALMAVPAAAQRGEMKGTVNYSYGFPGGDLKDFVDGRNSANGWGASFLYGISDHVSLGLAAGYQGFQKKYPRQVYQVGESDISAVLTNSVEMIPVLVKGRYDFSPGNSIQPYVAAGAGMDMVLYRQNLGEYEWDSRNRIAFHATPEAGVTFLLSKQKQIGLNISAEYNFVPFKYGVVNNLNYVAAKAGIVFPLRR